MAAPNITPKIAVKIVDWILYNMPMLQDQIKATETRLSTSVMVLNRQSTRGMASRVERVAIKRAAVSSVLDAAERGIRALHPEQRKVYRMKYRDYMTYKEIGRRLFVSEETVGRRLAEVRAVVAQYIFQVHASDLAEFVRFFK